MISDRIKTLREEKDISQAQLADAMGVNRMTINNYENGKRIPDIDFAMNCADYFGVTVEYLTGRSEFRHKDDFKKAIEKVQYLADIVDKLPTEEGRQMTNAFAEVLKFAQNAEVSEYLMVTLTNIYIQFAQLVLSYAELKENVQQCGVELKKANVEDELIKAVLREKPYALYAHGMSVSNIVSSLIGMFLNNLVEQISVDV